MIRELENGEFGMEGIIDFPLFGKEIEIHIKEGVSIDYAEKCVEYLCNLEEHVIEKLCEGSIKYCDSMREYFIEMDVSIPANITSREILKYIHPCSLIVECPEEDCIAFHMELNCDWEQEHGMEWSVKDGEVLYVGSFNDESPWRSKEYFKKASWNYVVK